MQRVTSDLESALAIALECCGRLFLMLEAMLSCSDRICVSSHFNVILPMCVEIADYVEFELLVSHTEAISHVPKQS